MMHSQYLRIESRAGGVHASPRSMIRAARRLLNSAGKSREQRQLRHSWLREVFVQQRDAQELMRKFRL